MKIKEGRTVISQGLAGSLEPCFQRTEKMNLASCIQRIIDDLTYNEAYAPHYPSEDRTTLEQQESSIHEQMTEAIAAAAKREDVGDWLRLANQSIVAAFQDYRGSEEKTARPHIQFAIAYLQNASSRKSFKPRFIATADGGTKEAT